MVSCPAQLDMVLNTIFKPVSKNTIDNVYRGAIWAFYSGLKKSQLSLVNNKGIDLNKLKMTVEDDEYPVYKEAVDSYQSCITLKEFAIIHPNYDKTGTDQRFVSDGSTFATTVGILDPNGLQQMINRKTKQAEKLNIEIPRLKVDKIRLSGIFYRAKQLESQGFDIDFTYIAKQDMEGKVYAKSKNSMTSRITERSKEYLAEYQRWCGVFYK